MRILVGVSHSLCRLGMVSFIESSFGVKSAKEANDFAALLQELGTDSHINMVIVDMDLAGMYGLNGLAKLHSLYPRLYIAALYEPCESHYSGIDILRAGARGYINRQLEVHALLPALTRVASGGVYLEADTIVDHGASGAEHKHLVTNIDELPRRQREVLELLRLGQSNKMIARNLGITEGTVKVHVAALYKHLGVHNRVEATLAIPQDPRESAQVIPLFS